MDLVRVRASSIPELIDCPARWEAKHLRGLRLPASGAALLGTAVHAGTALYDNSVLNGEGLTIDECAGAVVDTIQHPQEDVVWGEDSQSDSEKIGIALHTMYCEKIAPKQTYVAVEATCDSLDFPDLGISLTGTTDRVREDSLGNLGIADLKTGKSAVAADGTVKTAGHAAQIAAYELLAGVSLEQEITAPAQIVGLQVAKTEKGRRVGIGEITSAKEILLGTEDQQGLLEIASKMLKSGLMFGNPRSTLCNIKFCPAYTTCRWRR